MSAWRAALVLLATAVVAAAGCSASPAPDTAAGGPRFHHAHFRVPDPAATMDGLARAHDCEKLILPGLGVGVRCGDAYLLFDRDTAPPAGTTRASVLVTGTGPDAAIHVLVEAADPEEARAWLSTTFGDQVLQRISFAPKDPRRLFDDSKRRRGSLEAELAHLGVGLPVPPPEPVVRGPDGLVVEQVRDEGFGPDAFWCPMHPDVRSPAGGTCPLCGMSLVAMPESTIRRHRLDVDFQLARRLSGRLRLGIRVAESGERVTSFVTTHERLLHLFLISRQLDVFEHLHPTLQPDGRFVIDLDLPQDDAYMIVADVHPAGAAPEMLQSLWVTPGYRGSPFPDGSGLLVDRAPRRAGAIRVALTTGAIAAGLEQSLAFSVTDPQTGAPVRDLQPYLGAPGHLVIVSADLGDVVHSHPADVSSSGPEVTFDATFPRPGLYKMWMQVQRRGTVETAAFVIEVQ
ncbi:MAG TPA: heavy metal-binding domain-containing protein [Vicinamibacterales bacterium]|nr:heavy metal-binding domain-containing protein [Vicinamibacterales bacterium]